MLYEAFPADTRLTVYRRAPVSVGKGSQSIVENIIKNNLQE